MFAISDIGDAAVGRDAAFSKAMTATKLRRAAAKLSHSFAVAMDLARQPKRLLCWPAFGAVPRTRAWL
jgi:hypothetical protein